MTTRYPLVLNGTSIQELQNSDSLILPSALSISSGGTGLTSFTSGGVVYASSTSALATGSALTFDGNNLATSLSGGTGLLMTSSASQAYINLRSVATAGYEPFIGFGDASAGNIGQMLGINGGGLRWTTGGSEQMRLTSTGLGIGTSSPGAKLNLSSTGGAAALWVTNTTATTGKTWKFNSYDDGNLYIGIPSVIDAATFTPAGNLGLGVTPPASGSRAIYTGFATSSSLCMSMGASGGGYGLVGYNTAITNTSGSYNYLTSDTASAIQFYSGGFHFLSAPSGTAGNAITFTQAMTLAASGQLMVGNGPNNGQTYKLGVYSPSADTQLLINSDNGYNAYINFAGFGGGISYGRDGGTGYHRWNNAVNFGGSQVMTLTDSGKLSVNTTASPAYFNVANNGQSVISQEAGNSADQGTAEFNRVVKLCPSVSSNNKLIIPFVSQGNQNSTTVCRVMGHNAAFNLSAPYGFEITFAVGHLNAMYSLSYWGAGGNAVSAAINGQTVEITFSTAYNVTYGVSGGVFVTLEYMTNVLSYSIDVPNVRLN